MGACFLNSIKVHIYSKISANRLNSRNIGMYPLLAITVLKIADGSIFPADSKSWQKTGPESILTHDYNVGEEPCDRLDHAWNQHNEQVQWTFWYFKQQFWNCVNISPLLPIWP